MNAQEKKSTMDLLTLHPWITEDGRGYMRFDNEYMYRYSDYSDLGIDVRPTKRNYYLSYNESMDASYNSIYDPQLVGKAKEGKYIVMSYLVFQIKEISESCLVIGAITNSGGFTKYYPYTGPLPEGFPE